MGRFIRIVTKIVEIYAVAARAGERALGVPHTTEEEAAENRQRDYENTRAGRVLR